MACIPCIAAPLMYCSSLLAFLNKNKVIIILSIIIFIVSLYFYYKFKNCKECKKNL